ncbi:heat shock 70kDa protein 1/2/6/8 [Phycisphaerales bacterium]|nr:heat shock 70kDa protein 1/2/6/8 [Phycisphaerales bacterium]
MESGSELIVGIDLGTTNSLVAISDALGPRVIPDEHGRRLVPSVVRFDDGHAVVGNEAKSTSLDFPNTTVNSVKRLMGRSAEDARDDLKFLSYRVAPGERGTARIVLPRKGGGERLVSPEEVSAEILRSLVRVARRVLGRAPAKAVITVPAYFDDAQRQATRTAGRLAGLDVVRLVPEPTAAALAYGIGLPRAGVKPGPRNVVVYDLGGGTFDVSVLRLTPDEGGEPFFFQVLSVGGDSHLGGDDIDHLLVDVMRREIAAQLGLDADRTLELPPQARRQLVSLAESLKVRLSSEQAAAAHIDLGDDRVYERTLTREELERLITPLVDRTIECCRRAMAAAERALGGEPISAVVLVGGVTRTPLVRRRVAEFFGMEPYTALDPDEVVALGAAVQAQILSGSRRDALLLDVIPLSLGIETAGGAVAKVIIRNSTVPARATEMFSTQADGQSSIRLTVYQGEREMAEHCRKLGEFHLRDIPPMPAGVPQVEVAFLVDANGVLNVSAHERRSGKRAGLQVVPNHGLSPEEVERIERDSLTHAREDMTRHRVVDLVANSRLDLKWIGERLERHRGVLEPAYAAELDAAIVALRAQIEQAQHDWTSVNPEEFARAKDALDRASVRLQEVSISASLRENPAL